MLYDLLEVWMVQLRLAQAREIQYYRRQAQYVMDECKTVNEQLASLPIHVVEELTVQIVGEFVKQISSYHRCIWEFRRDELHNAVCTEILRSVLPPCTTRYKAGVKSSFEQILVIRTFNSTRYLTHLAFNTKVESDNSALLASNIHHLIHLLSFEYNYHCTDQVIEQLSLHCSKLKLLDVSDSPAVTDDCVDHLVKLKNLIILSVTDTSVSSESYGFLISALSNIANVKWSLPICDVLNSTSTEMFHTVTQVWGPVNDANILTYKCPNIRIIMLLSVYEDLSSLTSLNQLAEVYIQDVSYEVCNMRVVLEGVGHRLEHLQLLYVTDVDMADIVTLCCSLGVLELQSCTTVSTNLDTVIKRDLPHFKSVSLLIIEQTSENEVYYRHLGYYINLRVFMCKGVDVLSDSFMAESVQNGGFRNITRFEVNETGAGHLSMDTVILLFENCKDLKTIGVLGTWHHVTPEDIVLLENRVRMGNVNLKILK
jgi:hypothetical protein